MICDKPDAVYFHNLVGLYLHIETEFETMIDHIPSHICFS